MASDTATGDWIHLTDDEEILWVGLFQSHMLGGRRIFHDLLIK
jgi:hypothetical protein